MIFSAKNFMLETLSACQSVRPRAKWGFYRFPDCHDNEQITNCSQSSEEWDDKLNWLWNNQNAIYPSSYISIKTKNSENITRYVQSRTLEAWRILPKNKPDMPIYHYHR